MSASGEGPLIDTIVLLPGLDGTGELFASFVQALCGQPSVQIVRYPVNDTLGYQELEAIVRSQLPAGGRFALLGESFSGPIAISVAASPPPNLVACVLCCSFSRNPRPELARLRAALFAVSPSLAPTWLIAGILLGRHTAPSLRAALREVLGKVPARVIQARLREVLDIDVTERFTRIAMPVLYLQASADRLIPRGVGEDLQKLNPAIRLERVEGPHFLLQTQPKAAAAAIKAFLVAK